MDPVKKRKRWRPGEVITGPEGHRTVAFDDRPPGTYEGHWVQFERCALDHRVRMMVAAVYFDGHAEPWYCPKRVALALKVRARALLNK